MVVLRIALLIGMAWLLGRFIVRRLSRPTPPPANDVVTVPCHHCGLVLPEREAVRVRGHTYCAEHAPDD